MSPRAKASAAAPSAAASRARAPRGVQVLPLTPERWADFETLFGPRGACGGCWCMWWRLKRSDFEQGQKGANRTTMKKLVAGGAVPGLIAYLGEEPVGWASLGPREDYPVLGRSPVLKPVDETPVWSLVCFFIRREHRRRGLSRALIAAAKKHAKTGGARWLEAYPTEPKTAEMPDIYAFTGVPAMFTAAGFREIARRSPTRPILRCKL
jgi:GNAT superfamily N-acetyltransferase